MHPLYIGLRRKLRMPCNIPDCTKCKFNISNGDGGTCDPSKDECIINKNNSRNVEYSSIMADYNDDESTYMNL